LVEPPKTLRIEVYPKELDLIKQLLEARAAVLSHKVILSSVNHRNAPEEERLAAEIDFVRDLRMRLSFVGPDRSAT
jgi:DNA-binding winged helix-turn-helix (wHTH) protein